METSRPTITKNPVTGLVFTRNESVSSKDGKQYGFIRLEQTTIDMTSAVARFITKSALKSIAEETYNKAKGILVEGLELSGKIITEESLVKELGFNEKRAGKDENAPACKYNDQPIYMRTLYTEDMDTTDTLIAHTNTEEIKAYLASKVEATALN